MAFNSDALVSAVRRLAYLPDASDITAADILAFADEEQLTILDELVKTQRGEHWLTSEDVVLDSGQLVYRLPRRALGRFVRGIQLIANGNVIYGLPETDVISGWRGLPTGASSSIVAGAFSFVDDTITFPAPPQAGWTLRVYYLRRPSQLVPVSEAALVINAANATIVHTSTAPNWALDITTQIYVDIVRGDAPYDLSFVDRLLVGVDSPSPFKLTFSTDAPVIASEFVNLNTIANDRVDAVCLRDQTIYPQLPNELHPVLYAAVVTRVLEAVGDPAGTERALQTLNRRREAAENIISPRNEAASKPIIRRNSPLRQSRGRYRWR